MVISSHEFLLPVFAHSENSSKYYVILVLLVVAFWNIWTGHWDNIEKTLGKHQADIGENQINCYDNSGGSWKDTKITADNEMRITLELNDPFLSGRGRVNCTAKNNSEWLWFGYQFTVE